MTFASIENCVNHLTITLYLNGNLEWWGGIYIKACRKNSLCLGWSNIVLKDSANVKFENLGIRRQHETVWNNHSLGKCTSMTGVNESLPNEFNDTY